MSYVSSGKVIKATAAADIPSGAGVVIGDMLGIATANVANGAVGVFVVSGIVTLPLKSADTFEAGGKVYWDATEGHITVTSTENTFAGYYLDVDGDNAVVRLPL